MIRLSLVAIYTFLHSIQLGKKMDLSKSECVAIVKKKYKRDDVEVLSFGNSSADGAARGYIAVSSILWIQVLVDGKKETFRCFVKLPPASPYHFNLVQKTRAFYKEAQFFVSVYPLLKKYFTQKVFPKCLHASANVTILEDLGHLGYTNAHSETLDVDHLKATLKILANYHAASFLYENEVKSSFDQICPDILFVSWFSHLPDHPGNVHLRTGITAMRYVFDKYFPQVSEDVKKQAVKILEDLPNLLLPSKKHRNALSHNDLWSNNIMFKYSKQRKVDGACLIDLQLFGYNPPAHDLFTFLFLNSVNDSVRNRLTELVAYYYNSFNEVVTNFGFSADDFLSWADFEDSKNESVPLGLGSAVLFTHFTSLPEEYVSEFIHNEKKLTKFMEDDRKDVIINSIENYPAYKNRLFSMINNLFDYLKGDFNV